MRAIQTMSAAIAVTCLLAFADTTLAQNPVRRPTLSPYLQLLRPQTTPLPNYQSFVQPRIQAQRDRVQQYEVNNRLQGEITGQRQELSAFAAGGIRATGRTGAGGYMNFLHYYPSAGSGARAIGR